ncbi:anthranilate synthase component I family protein [bacterium]|nr:anthranilate synthase component I family protein [bacterium]
MKLLIQAETVLADTVTPVAAYLRLRDQVPGCLLFESNDYQPGRNALSFLCIDPIKSFSVVRGEIRVSDREPFLSPSDDCSRRGKRSSPEEVRVQLQHFFESFEVEYDESVRSHSPFSNEVPVGIFGYSSFDAVQYFEEISFRPPEEEIEETDLIPELLYQAFRFVLVFDPTRNELTVLESEVSGQRRNGGLDRQQVISLALHADYPSYRFRREGEQSSNFTENEFLEVIARCQQHIQRGDVFQIVPSRKYHQPYQGDDFSVYRALRRINPSPYLFYFDYGRFRVFGSSPEAQLVVRGGEATLFPIAGTYRRTHDSRRDQEAIKRLLEDEKENAEHVMLVDLARNDLSRHCSSVRVESYRGVQLYSHVIHLTSEIVGTLRSPKDALALFCDTFPMGTLSGAPKYRALQLLDQYEQGRRGLYGGAVGMFGFDGAVHHAIVIRSFVSQNQVLTFQAGAGVVSDSVPASEAQEVRNKLAALQQALVSAEEIRR